MKFKEEHEIVKFFTVRFSEQEWTDFYLAVNRCNVGLLETEEQKDAARLVKICYEIIKMERETPD